ncbi:class I SAM-dependent methyltransferase [Trichocoleus sp. DQ-U1]|uniref:class I SAM-dependent methyltransferase n=1 Tax=Trichocoleus sp. DQ-U1 TaxID=2933926 RepID=UPI003298893F
MNTIDATDVNYLYFVHYIKQIPGYQSFKILDFGCGNGNIVQLMRSEGIDCYGADVFYSGASYKTLFENELFKNKIIREITENGEIPFEDSYFDIIISNQVFEHINDKESVLKQIERVVKPNGLMYHHFPSKEVIREGHIGIPMVHWMAKGKFRYLYTVLLRGIGLGYFKNGVSISKWAKEKLDWIDKYCFYEKYADIYSLFAGEYIIYHREIEYCRFRARNNSMLKFLLSIELFKEIYQYLFRRLGFMAIELRKRDNCVAVDIE